jgi:hypothetical protein
MLAMEEKDVGLVLLGIKINPSERRNSRNWVESIGVKEEMAKKKLKAQEACYVTPSFRRLMLCKSQFAHV